MFSVLSLFLLSRNKPQLNSHVVAKAVCSTVLLLHSVYKIISNNPLAQQFCGSLPMTTCSIPKCLDSDRSSIIVVEIPTFPSHSNYFFTEVLNHTLSYAFTTIPYVDDKEICKMINANNSSKLILVI